MKITINRKNEILKNLIIEIININQTIIGIIIEITAIQITQATIGEIIIKIRVNHIKEEITIKITPKIINIKNNQIIRITNIQTIIIKKTIMVNKIHEKIIKIKIKKILNKNHEEIKMINKIIKNREEIKMISKIIQNHEEIKVISKIILNHEEIRVINKIMLNHEEIRVINKTILNKQ